jgi:membrane protein DedA with SNARE-associated domain
MTKASWTQFPDNRNGLPIRARGKVALGWTALVILLLAAILTPFLLFERQIEAALGAVFAAARGHPWLGGGVIVALLAGDAVLPVPSSLVSAFAGAAYHWRLGAAIIWIGMCLGCVFAYALGMSAGRFLALPLVGEAQLRKARRLFTDIGPALLIVARAVPVLAEASALAAGAARMPFAPFMISTSVANAGVAVAYAATGAAAVSNGSFLIVFIGLVTIPAIGWTVWRVVLKRPPPNPN